MRGRRRGTRSSTSLASRRTGPMSPPVVSIRYVIYPVLQGKIVNKIPCPSYFRQCQILLWLEPRARNPNFPARFGQLRSRRLRIDQIAYAVPEEIEPEHGQRDRAARKH